MLLPTEIRKLIIAQYVHLEVNSGNPGKRCHPGGPNHRCCVWDYPDVLVICNAQDPTICSGKRRFTHSSPRHPLTCH